ncbi:glucose-6-phosphate isomerase family protein [Paratissierella segnis]|jgi:oxalate decarboxylase/phosphoglucose isomerase-like protein (cupin superfamily)|uniref:glucose-6-phosphate isomerase n=1 Tax=Paratissierella segnis TaxID=2763679 RepID=A0A926EQG7_9FIRM|nr:glucose-6-phosphate isomerase family protein [Paratissierella segnis]MBC8587853.1 glucose-6-phosphate isomerase [Paratissierella segnis]
MLIDLSFPNSILKVKYNDKVNKLVCDRDLIIEEEAVRMLSDMNTLFRDLNPDFEDEPLYYMINGVCYPEHKELFDNYRLKYEYTVLLPKLIGGEFLKAHGHIHYAKTDPDKSIMEFMEVIHGKGVFLLFLPSNKGFEVIIVNVKPGDRFIVPKEYYHLTINTGSEPFIFSDIISNVSGGDYSLLKERKGAPVLMFKDSKGGIRLDWNHNYLPIEKITICDADSIPWDQPFTIDGPLYEDFLSSPDKYRILANPY